MADGSVPHPHGWCLVCGKKVDVDCDDYVVRHLCDGNGTPSHPYAPGDDEFTPPEIYEPVLAALGRTQFAFDPSSHPDSPVPAASRLYFEHDGLSFNWDAEETGWGQPPYSSPRPWIERFARHPGGMACLLSGDFSTTIWEDVIWPEALFLILLHKRVRHISPHRQTRIQAKRPSALVFFDPLRVIEWYAPAVKDLHKMGKVVA